MHITALYLGFKAGNLTIEGFAERIGISPRQLTVRLGKHGSQIEKHLRVLDKISDNTITRAQAASEWGSVNVRTINAAMRSWGVERKITEDMVNRVTPKIKWEIIKKYSVDFIQGKLDLVKSAKAAGISDRQLRRWVSDLLKKHYDMPFKDLKHVSQARRQALASDILEAESLELAKIRSVLTGEVSIFQEAEHRIAVKRAEKAERRAKKSANISLLDERKARKLVSDLVKSKGFTYAQIKSMPKSRRSDLLKPLLEETTPEEAELVIAHLETLEDV